MNPKLYGGILDVFGRLYDPTDNVAGVVEQVLTQRAQFRCPELG
jgi:hypothetical protein